MTILPRFIAAIAALAMLAGPAMAAPVVNAPAGSVEGLREGDANVFRAIPYALPPIGARRWRPPAPMPSWKGVRAAQMMGVACMQATPIICAARFRCPRIA